MYGTSVFSWNGWRQGPYEDRIRKGCIPSDTDDCGCSQGARQVWSTYIRNDYTYALLPNSDFTFTSCGSSAADVDAPITFGQSAALSGATFVYLLDEFIIHLL